MKLNRGEPDHPHWKTPFTSKEMAAAWWGLGVCVVALGIAEWFNPSQVPFSGRWSWIKSMAFDALGQRGPSMLYFGLGGLMLAFGCLKWGAHQVDRKK